MRILLIGEYSNVHHTLRDALRRQGHDVLLMSDGDGWKDYPRDIDLRRRSAGPWGSLRYLLQLLWLLPRLRGYDVVQLINPDVLRLKAHWNRWFFDYLRRVNRKVSVGCYGDDYYCLKRSQGDYVTMRQRAARQGVLPPFLAYTDLWAAGHDIDTPLNRQRIQAWCYGPKADLTRHVMRHAHCLVACLYEYYKVYDTDEFRSRLHYVPLPVAPEEPCAGESEPHQRVRILLAVQSRRAAMKGTDLMEPLFMRLASSHPDAVELRRIDTVPFAEYCRLLEWADVVVDQLYSYTPAMNALESMRRGKVVVSGGEPDYYAFEEQRHAQLYGASADPAPRPILNLRPMDDEANYALLEQVLTDPAEVRRRQQESRRFVERYHDADRVAQAYVRIWEN